jgi:SAM-dependent methyltransferase
LLLGLVPDQQRAISEMARVVRPGGLVVVAAHGPEYFWEAADAAFRSISKPYVLGYRFEFWPRSEEEWVGLFRNAGLTVEASRRVSWQNRFNTGGEVFDFFSAVSSSWWLERFPTDRRTKQVERGRRYFERKGVKELTDDFVVIAARRNP